MERRHEEANREFDLLSTSFPKQALFVRDESPRIVAFCTRRAAKTWGAVIRLLEKSLRAPRTQSLFVSYTRKKAWSTIAAAVAHFAHLYGISYVPRIGDSRFDFANGSSILCRGADKLTEIEKLRGEPYPLAIMDECGHSGYAKSLDYIVDEVLEPTVAQYDGTIIMLGTPGLEQETLFYRASESLESDWSLHRWTWEDNTTLVQGKRVCDQLRKTLARRLKKNPSYIFTDGYAREWQGKWVIEKDQLCYKFSKNYLIDRLPCKTCGSTSIKNPCEGHAYDDKRDEYFYILGSDMGWEDDTSFVVLAYHPNDPNLYIVESYKSSKLDFFDVCRHVSQNLHSRYRFVQYVIDGSGKQGVQTMRNRFNIPWKATTKSPNYKHDAIRQMASDFVSGAIKIIAPTNEALISEYKKLVWDPNHPAKEKASCKNHAADAALYGFLESRHWMAKAPQTEDEEFNPYIIDEPEPSDFFAGFDLDPNEFKWK